MKYGAILRACRERNKMSQEELAFQLNVGQSDISKFENDIKEPSPSLLRDWGVVTSSQEVIIAFLIGIDGLTILTEVLNVVGHTVITCISWLPGGIF